MCWSDADHLHMYCCLLAESERMRETEDEFSDEPVPQLPASVHVRKSSVACSKVRQHALGPALLLCAAADSWEQSNHQPSPATRAALLMLQAVQCLH